MFDVERDGFRSIFLIHGLCKVTQILQTFLKCGFIMVTNDKGKGGGSHISGHIGQMIESFPAAGVCRRFRFRKPGNNFTSHQCCIDHNVFCFARMNIYTFNMKDGTCGIKIFVSHFAFVITVHCVCIICLKDSKIKQIRTCADFFVRRKSDPEFPVWCTFCNQFFHGCHDFGNTCLVISAQKCGTVCSDQGSSF